MLSVKMLHQKSNNVEKTVFFQCKSNRYGRTDTFSFAATVLIGKQHEIRYRKCSQAVHKHHVVIANHSAQRVTDQHYPATVAIHCR